MFNVVSPFASGADVIVGTETALKIAVNAAMDLQLLLLLLP